MDPIFTIAEAAKLIAAKKLSPVELTNDCIARVKAHDGTLHAFILPTEDRALADARAAETRVMAGEAKGPLDGIPVGHKDIYNTAGIRTTGHSKLLEDNVPTQDATSVRKWAEAGVVLMGKLATHEFAMGGPSFDLPWPPARNPWNPEHFTSGSSSGTGAAVASGMILGGTGSDTGGSIRGPAALCGIAGIKPTYGLVSRTGVLPLSFSMDHAGPMAWTVEDCALLLQAMAGHDPTDPASADRPVADFVSDISKGVKGMRIGVARHFFETDNPVSPATLAGINHGLEVFEHLGAEISEVTLSPLAEWHACGTLISLTERASAYEEWARTRLGDFSARVQQRLLLGAMVSGVDYVQAVRRRRELRAELRAAMAQLDLVLTAAQPSEAPKIDEVPEWDVGQKPGFTMPFNVTGLPAIAVCAGFGEAGLPVSIQLVGHPFAEQTVFRAAHAYETATEWRKRRPAMAF